ncbi:homeobox KN domain containing protein [Nitzschia inconspicua]|uniref:Homeobox KN domain containing protein n=1 Tax=Nitzschia inconspicua TaxID=303405 RepID=A0A9K3LJD8_9STRA|nr:homeobox KN domain containing protein [Nitzschia inconspicua]
MLSSQHSPSSITSREGGSAVAADDRSAKNGGRRNASLPPEAVAYLKSWILSPEHIAHPYPTDQEKAQIMKDTGITLKQLTNWMVNNRKRLWKPRIEARLQQQAQAAVAAVAAHAHAAALSAATFSDNAAQQQQEQALSTMVSNLVTPEVGRQKTSITMPAPTVNSLVRFDTETSRKHLVTQLKPISPQPSLPSPADAATKAVQSLLTHQHKNLLNDRNVYLSADNVSAVVTEPSPSPFIKTTEEKVCDSVPFTPDESDDTAAVIATTAPTSLETTTESNTKSYTRNVSFCSLELVSGDSSSDSSATSTRSTSSAVSAIKLTKVSTKRSRSQSLPTQPAVVTPRKKYRRVSLDMWVDACSKASHIHDETLPSFEEASRLFGFSK